MDKDLAILVMGFVLGIIGSFLTVFYSFALARLIEIAFIVLGLAMIAGYCYITWDWFEEKFGEDGRIAIFLVPLIVFGAAMIFFSLTSTGIKPPHDTVMSIMGALIIIAPSAYFWFNQR